MGSTNAILITPTDPWFSGQKVERYGTPYGAQWMPKERKFDFKGLYEWELLALTGVHVLTAFYDI